MTGCIILTKTGQVVLISDLSVSRAKYLRKLGQEIMIVKDGQRVVIEPRQIRRIVPVPTRLQQ